MTLILLSARACAQAFTPLLSEIYRNIKSTPEGASFEIVFVSSDRDAESFKKYFADQPWTAVPYEQRDVKDHVAKQFQVMSVPTLIVLDGETGQVIDRDGRTSVMQRKNDVLKHWQTLAAAKR